MRKDIISDYNYKITSKVSKVSAKLSKNHGYPSPTLDILSDAQNSSGVATR